ncbi:hypothetical protein H4R35_005433, partial [Dimargaris xerosporica]
MATSVTSTLILEPWRVLSDAIALFYIAITAICLGFYWWPVTRPLVRHGKTNIALAPSEPSSTLWHRFQCWTVPKRRFSHFYVLGSIWNALLLALLLVTGTKWPTDPAEATSAFPQAPFTSGYRYHWMAWAVSVPPTVAPWLSPLYGGIHPLWSHLGGAVLPPTRDGPTAVITGRVPWPTFIALGLFQLHLVRRVVECYWLQRPSAVRMHVGHYALGLSFYLVTCLAWVVDGITITQPGSTNPAFSDRPALAWLVLTLGIAVYALASYHQHQSHAILANLRRPKLPCKTKVPKASTSMVKGQVTTPEGQAVYRIPYGGWFVWVECPHYLCEIMIYAALTAI